MTMKTLKGWGTRSTRRGNRLAYSSVFVLSRQSRLIKTNVNVILRTVESGSGWQKHFSGFPQYPILRTSHGPCRHTSSSASGDSTKLDAGHIDIIGPEAATAVIKVKNVVTVKRIFREFEFELMTKGRNDEWGGIYTDPLIHDGLSQASTISIQNDWQAVLNFDIVNLSVKIHPPLCSDSIRVHRIR